MTYQVVRARKILMETRYRLVAELVAGAHNLFTFAGSPVTYVIVSGGNKWT